MNCVYYELKPIIFVEIYGSPIAEGAEYSFSCRFFKCSLTGKILSSPASLVSGVFAEYKDYTVKYAMFVGEALPK